MRAVGLHLRCYNTIQSVVEYALPLNLTTFQCFLIDQVTKKYLEINDRDVHNFLAMRSHFGELYVHGSYLINLARTAHRVYHPLLYKEVALAERLEFNYIVLHPGSIAPNESIINGIDAVVRVLNRIFKHYPALNILLENTAHGNRTIGGNLEDFQHILAKIDYPERLKFCLDTAHAYCYGYDIKIEQTRNDFFNLVHTLIGLERVALIHLNDTKKGLASREDQHEIISKGLLGWDALKAFAIDERMKKIPIILEMPEMPQEEENKIVEEIKSWDKKGDRGCE